MSVAGRGLQGDWTLDKKGKKFDQKTKIKTSKHVSVSSRLSWIFKSQD